MVLIPSDRPYQHVSCILECTACGTEAHLYYIGMDCVWFFWRNQSPFRCNIGLHGTKFTTAIPWSTFSSAPKSNDVRHRLPGGRYSMKSLTWTQKLIVSLYSKHRNIVKWYNLELIWIQLNRHRHHALNLAWLCQHIGLINMSFNTSALIHNRFSIISRKTTQNNEETE